LYLLISPYTTTHKPSTLLSVFCSHLCPPLTSTLFPYTTLFRSFLHFYARNSICANSHNIIGDGGFQRGRKNRSRPSIRKKPHRQDRKSTRLNSSHVKISYAVFCLKKKKKTESDMPMGWEIIRQK